MKLASDGKGIKLRVLDFYNPEAVQFATNYPEYRYDWGTREKAEGPNAIYEQGIITKIQYDSFDAIKKGSGLSSNPNDVRTTLFWSSGADSVMVPIIENNKGKTALHYIGFFTGISYFDYHRHRISYETTDTKVTNNMKEVGCREKYTQTTTKWVLRTPNAVKSDIERCECIADVNCKKIKWSQ